MKYEEIKVGESYKVGRHTRKVIAKSDEHNAVMTIDEDGGTWAWDKDELKDFQPIKKELPESGLVAFGSNTIAYRTGKSSGFGFNAFGRYENTDDWAFENWRTATPEEEAKFIKLLEQEAEKRGLGVDAKIKGHADNTLNYRVNEGEWDAIFHLTSAWNKNGQIFKNGIWAEPLTMLDEVCDVIKKHLPNIVVEMTDGVVTLKQL